MNVIYTKGTNNQVKSFNHFGLRYEVPRRTNCIKGELRRINAWRMVFASKIKWNSHFRLFISCDISSLLFNIYSICQHLQLYQLFIFNRQFHQLTTITQFIIFIDNTIFVRKERKIKNRIVDNYLEKMVGRLAKVNAQCPILFVWIDRFTRIEDDLTQIFAWIIKHRTLNWLLNASRYPKCITMLSQNIRNYRQLPCA